jgi:hypothetical protein
MAEIVITALLSVSMWVAIWLLGKRRRRAAPLPDVPGHLTAAERRRLYKRLGIDPEVMARQRPFGAPAVPSQAHLLRRRSTRA